jgi:hypothetical protein
MILSAHDKQSVTGECRWHVCYVQLSCRAPRFVESARRFSTKPDAWQQRSNRAVLNSKRKLTCPRASPIPAAAEQRECAESSQQCGTGFWNRVKGVAVEVHFIADSCDDDVGLRVSSDPVGGEK